MVTGLKTSLCDYPVFHYAPNFGITSTFAVVNIHIYPKLTTMKNTDEIGKKSVNLDISPNQSQICQTIVFFFGIGWYHSAVFVVVFFF